MESTESVVILPRFSRSQRLVAAALKSMEGKHEWGFIESSVLSRGQWMRERLTVYPPGTKPADRRIYALYRQWPVAGAVACLALMIAGGRNVPPALAGIIAAALYATGFLVGHRMTQVLRDSSVQLSVVTTYLDGHAVQIGNVERFRTSRVALMAIEEQRRTGRLSPAQFEFQVGRVYRRLDEDRDSLSNEVVDRRQKN